VSGAENVEDARPQEVPPFFKHPFLASDITEAAEVKIKIEIHSSGLLHSEL
jgi:hypothetical protein